ncbi:MAG: hypothetical protein IIC82_06095 [Chloroflexi bacterium]|nr:hypothetical protein [Chloroflexota bacterium]
MPKPQNYGSLATDDGTVIIDETADALRVRMVGATETISAPKRATITAGSSGNTQVVAAVTGKQIRPTRIRLNANGAVNSKFQSASNEIDGLGLFYHDAAGSGYTEYEPSGLGETVAGEALNINLSGAIAISGGLTYVEVG